MKPASPFRSSRRGAACEGFSLVEAVLAILVTGILMVAALSTTSASALARSKSADRSRGRFLAQDLMCEILDQCYEEPDDGVLFGPEPGESSGTRSNFDDVDDYNGWVETTPSRKGGSAIGGLNGWKRSVLVEWVLPSDPAQSSGSETGAKRITVTVEHNGAVVASWAAIRTNAP